MPDLHVELEVFGEGNVVEDVKPADAGVAVVAGAVAAGLVMVGMHEALVVAPGVTVVILGAGAEMARKRFAVDVDFLVALAPPVFDGIGDMEHVAHETALAIDGEVGPILAGLGRDVELGTPFRVEIEASGCPFAGSGDHGAFDGHRGGSVVGDAQGGGLSVGHYPLAVHGSVVPDAAGE